MPITTDQQKRQAKTMKAYQKPQCTYRYCQQCNVTPSHTLIVGMCLLMLPMLELATEHVQLATTYYMNPINNARLCLVTFSHAPLALPSLNNNLAAMVLQNRIAWPNIMYPSYTSSFFNVHCISLSPPPTAGSRKRVVKLVVLLLLLMCGDIETNPGPVGECTYTVNTKCVGY